MQGAEWKSMKKSIDLLYRGPGFLAVVWFGSLPPPHPLPAIHRKTEKERQLADGRGVGEEPSLRRRESTVLYKLFNTLWFFLSWNKKEKTFYIMRNIYKQQKSGSFLQQVRQRMWRMHICTLTDALNIYAGIYNLYSWKLSIQYVLYCSL
jgi:hypothetical protein